MTTANCNVTEGFVYEYDVNAEYQQTLDRDNLQAAPTVTVDLSGLINSDGDDVAAGTISALMLANEVADAMLTAAVTVSDEAADVVTVTVQVKDIQDADLSDQCVLDFWLGDAAGGVLTSDSFTGGGIAATTGTIVVERTADTDCRCITDSNGLLVLTFTETGANTLYFNLILQGRYIAGSQSMVWAV